MHWIRAHLRFSSRLALFALAVQMVLSFGHVHIATPTLASTNEARLAVADESGLAASRAIAPIHKSDGSVSGGVGSPAAGPEYAHSSLHAWPFLLFPCPAPANTPRSCREYIWAHIAIDRIDTRLWDTG